MLRRTSFAFLLSASAGLAPAFAADSGKSTTLAAPTLQALDYSGAQTALDDLDREIANAGTDAAKLAPLESRLLAIVRSKEPNFAARQAAATRLALVLAQTPAASRKPDTLKPFAGLLADERDAEIARLALEPVAGADVDALFVAALSKTTDRTRLGHIDTLARRRAAGAVDALAALLKNSEPVVAATAARALGDVGNTAAIAALRAAPNASAPAIVGAKLAAARQAPAADAAALLTEIQRDARSDSHRAGALRLALDLNPAQAPAKIAEVLAGSDYALKAAALESLTALPAANTVPALAPKLSSFDPLSQAALLTAFGRAGHAAAVPAAVAAAKHENAEVRGAAITALGRLPGTKDTATLLAQIAAGDNSTDAKLARLSLARLTGADVGAAVIAGAKAGDAKLRAVYIEQLSARNMADQLPLILELRKDTDASVRAAAIGSLGEIGTAAEQAALLAWAAAATDSNEQSRALRAIVSLTQRIPDAGTRGKAVFTAIEQAPPDAAARLVPVLTRLGGIDSAEAAGRLALRNDAAVADAAVAALGRWTDGTALPALANVAEKAPLASIRAAALKSALTYLEKNRDPWTAETTGVFTQLTAGATDAETRQRLLKLFTRANDDKSIALVEKLQADPAATKDTVAIIRANKAGKPKVRVSSGSASGILDGKSSTRWTVDANGEEWVEIDFLVARPIRTITLDQSGRATEFPERYEVIVSNDLKADTKPLVSGIGQRNRTVIELPAGTNGRYLLIKNTAERKDTPWSIVDLFVD